MSGGLCARRRLVCDCLRRGRLCAHIINYGTICVMEIFTSAADAEADAATDAALADDAA